jgi:hypothetical protein
MEPPFKGLRRRYSELSSPSSICGLAGQAYNGSVLD